MLNSVDLFTGVGGFALALRDIARPLLYCDSAPHVQKAIAGMIRDGRLPAAPVVDDVKNVDDIIAAVGTKRVHVVTGGFPCVGFSHAGSRAGLDNDASSLFHAMMTVVQALKPDMVFMENVVEVLTAKEGRDYRVILAEFAKHGYVVRWTTCSAMYVGAPHMRNRWFGMCVRTDARLLDVRFKQTPGPWKTRCPPPIVRKSPNHSTRVSMLGNALVPAAARLAFARLYSGFAIVAPRDLEAASSVSWKSVVGRSVRKIPKHGEFSRSSGMLAVSIGDVGVPRTLRIALDPAHFRTNQVYQRNSIRVPSPRVRETVVRSLFPTPRASMATHGHVLSERTIRDLPTFAMYMAEMNGRRFPKTSDGDSINPRFVEWLMGYPLDHTRLERA